MGCLHPWIEVSDIRPNFCVGEFVLQLDLAFGNPCQTEKAVDRLNTIQQGTDAFHTFISEFNQTLLEARG